MKPLSVWLSISTVERGSFENVSILEVKPIVNFWVISTMGTKSPTIWGVAISGKGTDFGFGTALAFFWALDVELEFTFVLLVPDEVEAIRVGS